MGHQRATWEETANTLQGPPPPSPSRFTFLSLGFPATALPFYFFSLSSPGGEKKSLFSCLLQGKLKVRLLSAWRSAVGGCEGERHLLPCLLSEVSQRGSSKWVCLEAGPSGPRDWYMPCQTWNSEETEADERVISQDYHSRYQVCGIRININPTRGQRSN